MPQAEAATAVGATPGDFSVSPTGAATYSVPIAVPPGTAGMAPKLVLGYSSQSGNGLAGSGWSLSGLSAISRCPSTIAQDSLNRGVQEDAKDKFCMDGQRLIAVNGIYGADGTEYRTEIESFTRVISHGATSTGPQWFEAWTKSGQHMEYGNTADSNVMVSALTTGGVTPTIAWAINKSSDTAGNYLTFSYTDDPANGQFYPKEIDYTGNANASPAVTPYNKVTFSYANRAVNPPAVYLNGYKSQITQRLVAITTWAGATQARTYTLNYQNTSDPNQNDFLSSVQEGDGAGNSLNATNFAWQYTTPPSGIFGTPTTITGVDLGLAYFASSGDVNGDSYDDLLTDVGGSDGISHLWLRVATGNPAAPFGTAKDVGITTLNRDCSLVANCIGSSGSYPIPQVSVLGDVNGDGRADLILADGRVALGQADGSFGVPYQAYIQTGITCANTPSTTPCQMNAASFVVARDVNGDGYADLMYGVAQSDNLTHYYIQYAIPPSQTGGNVNFAAPVQIATAPLMLLADIRPGYPWTPPPTIPNVPCAATLGDVNGDGRADLITCQGQVYLTTDYGFAAGAPWMPLANFPNSFGAIYTPGFLSAGDVNGDGLSDVLVKEEDISVSCTEGCSNNYSTSNITTFEASEFQFIAPSDGHGVSQIGYAGTPGAFGEIEQLFSTSPTTYNYRYIGSSLTGLLAGNFSGQNRTDGISFGATYLPATVYNSGSSIYPLVGYATFLPAQVATPPLITKISDGLGASRTIAYSQLNNNAVYTAATGAIYPDRDIQSTASALYVVSSTAASNGVGSNFVLNYRYTGGRVDAHGRGFLGFQSVTAVDPQSGITTTTTYRLDFPYTGMVASQAKTIQNPQNQTVTLNSVYNGYSVLAIPATTPSTGMPSETCPSTVCVQYPYQSFSIAQNVDLDGTSLPYVVSSYQNLDWYGNPGTVRINASDNHLKTTTNTYTNDPTHWILGRLSQSQVTSNVPDGTTAGWSMTRTSAFQYDPTNGFLTEETIEPNQPEYELITDYTYDAFGNRATATVSGGSTASNDALAARTSKTSYDARGQFPVTITNALNQSETHAYDPRFGTLTSLTGPNGLTTTWNYDGFGRKIKESRADATATTWSYLACASGGCSATASTGQQLSSTLPTAAYAVLTENTGIQNGSLIAASAPVMTVYDNLKRAVRTVAPSADGSQLVDQDTQYNLQGWVAQTSLPYFSGAATLYWNTTSYDVLGRPATITDPAGHQTYMAYHGLTTVATNALGQTKTEVKNSQGQTVSVTDAASNITTYTYDPFGNLRQVTDPQGHVTAALYDIRGHKFLASDPDTGIASYAYDPLGELLSSTDAKSQTTTYTYDLLGRLTQRTEPDLTSYWEYDTATNGIGKLSDSYTSAGSHTHFYFYDALSRPTKVISLLPGDFPTTQRTYDSAGRVATQVYPDGFTYKNIYNVQGALTEVDPAGTYSGTNTYLWKALAWDAAGHVTQEQFGNGVTTTHSYDPATLHQTAIAAGASNSVMNQSYTYDALGNVQTRVDPLAGTSEAYTYDTINRLTQDATTLTNGCASNCTSSVNVTYDALGDITSKSDIGTYTYTDSNHIHAVTQAGSNTYTYDPDGNMRAGGGRSYTWMASNLPASVTANGQTTSWTYDADRNRVTQSEPGKTTVFLNPRVDLGMHYEQVTYTGGRVDGVHILYAGGEVIGQYTTTNQTGVPPSTTRYWSTDPLGSVIAMTSDTGVVTDRYAYDPWGKQQILSGSQDDTDHGFTGQEHLAVGLVQLNGRLYDPVIGRMVSVDPVIQDAFDLQSYNGYSYARNNPMCYVDPSGLSWWTNFRDKILKPVVAAVAAYFVGPEVYGYVGLVTGSTIAGTIASAAIVGAETSLITTSSFQGWQYNALTAVAFSAVGDVNETAGWGPGSPQAVFDHALVGGATSAAAGGSFKSGFLSAGFAEAAIPVLGDHANVFSEAIVGGTASVLAGGKFVNGAITGAFGYLFNDCKHDVNCLNFNDHKPGNVDTPDGQGNWMWVSSGAAGNATCGGATGGSLCGNQFQTDRDIVNWGVTAGIFYCPECKTMQVLDRVSLTAAVWDAYTTRDPASAVPAVVGTATSTFLRTTLSLPESVSARVGIVVDKSLEWFIH